eukprot:TRINITY_DN2813_c0_g1_i4.p1 TRINITY_DN2813_c0_g1~~TRINITY_DN2813_c0_g1_i4.p1  ORF type:complete len:536 (-),score=85.07 TRINITY_DN2813_c0_g1_i4:41-1621(-)
MLKVGVTPWSHPDEWNHVRELVLNRDREALQYFQVWRSRSVRLPVGIEITAALLEASSDFTNSLSLSMGINRFINHVSHLGMNIYGFSKLYSAAEALGIPEWIVDVRHDATHGQMPSLYMLRSAFDTCWSWILLNYWEHKKVCESSEVISERLPHLLDLYMYLKIYNIWGTTSLSSIASEEAVYSHIHGLWASSIQINGNNLLKYSVKQALECVSVELEKLNASPLEVARTLVEEDLLVPPQEFLQSLLKDGEEDSDCVELPKILISVWRNIIESIDHKIGARHLVDCLVDKIGQDYVEESVKEYSSAWVVEITEGMAGRSNNLKLKTDHGCTLASLESWLATPNRLIQMLLPCFAGLVCLKGKSVSLLDQLISAAINETDSKSKYDKEKVFSIDDIGVNNNVDVSKKESLKDKSESNGMISSTWIRQPDSQWSRGKLYKTFPGQTWDSLWLPDSCTWEHPKLSEGQVEDDICGGLEVEAVKVLWPGQKRPLPSDSDSNDVPAFYRNEVVNTKKQFTPKKKRSKRS